MSRKVIYRILAGAGIISALAFFGVVWDEQKLPIFAAKDAEGASHDDWCESRVAVQEEGRETLFIGCNGFF